MTEDKFHSVHEKIDRLIKLCEEMKQENQVLKASENEWQVERQQLVKKNSDTKTKLESILGRLKSLEHS